MATTRVVSLVIEITEDDGTTHIETMTDGCAVHLNGTDNDQHFWVATNHGSLLSGTHAMASPNPGQAVPENYKSWTETMIGLIRDGHANVFLTYTPGNFKR